MDIDAIKKNYGVTDDDFAKIVHYTQKSSLTNVDLEADFMRKQWSVDPAYAFPAAHSLIQKASASLGFDIASDNNIGQLLSVLAASKPKGRFLEIGTGCGLGTSWILSGMCSESSLISIETNATWLEIAKSSIKDKRVEFVLGDALQHIMTAESCAYDFIFADALPGKYFLVDEAINLLKPGGFYIIDDCIHQEKWPKEIYFFHRKLMDLLQNRKDITLINLHWSVGVCLAVKKL